MQWICRYSLIILEIRNMMLIQRVLLVTLLSFFALAQTYAEETVDIKTKLETIMPGVTVDSVDVLNNTGLYEAVINGEIVYFTEDLRYVIQGDVISLETRQNITENKRVSLRKQALASLKEADMIVYEPTKKTEHTITVFTDIDCGYCRKLHQQMTDYNDLGIRIRYMAFPRAGVDSESFDKAEDVWCSDDRQQAMTDAKSGVTVETKTCNSPVKAQYELGRKIGVQGTPALFLESGQMLPGYVPPKRLKQMLDEQALTKF
jgi:thiol:disulfide interchange protein DsbC